MKKKRLINVLKTSLAMVGILGTMVLSNIQVAQAEKIIHTHIWATKYDKDKHWEYCTVCKEVKNESKHSFKDNWFQGVESCTYQTYNTKICDCGYSYIYHKPHGNTNEWRGINSRLLHYINCKDCGTWTKSERCKDDGGYLSCKNPGTCNVCGVKATNDNHFMTSKGKCRDCGTKLVDITEPTVTYDSVYKTVTIKFTMKPVLSNLELTGLINAHCPNVNYSQVKWTHVKNSDKSVTYTAVYTFNPKTQRKSDIYVGDLVGFAKVNGVNLYSDGSIARLTIWQDHTKPEVNEVKQVDQKTHNNWATIKELTISGKEDLSSIVTISILDKQTKDVIIDKAKSKVENGQFSYKCTPPLEGPETGREYILKVEDEIGNVEEKTFTIYRTDCRAPLIRSGKEYTEWSKTKNIALELTDYGAGAPETSLNDQVSYKKATKDGDKYKALYTFAEDKYDVSEYTLYLRDGLGNATKDTFKVGKVDNTKPTVTEVKSVKKDMSKDTASPSATGTAKPTSTTTSTSEPTNSAESTKGEKNSTAEPTSTTSAKNVEITIKANDKNKKLNAEGSGVAGYALTKTMTEPKAEEWKKENTLTVKEIGKYYLWVKDAVGNIADITVVNVKDDFTIEVTEEKIEYDNGKDNDEITKPDDGSTVKPSDGSTSKPNGGNTEGTGEDDATPKTGDAAPIILVAVILLISGAVMVVVRVRKKKRIV